jgi:RNA 2',3'-cyclic 3'-phosphodiesterase
MRAFVALDVPGPTVDSMVSFQGELSATGADLKLVERENLHLNVKFLGEINEAQAADVRSILGSLGLRGAEVEVKGAGAFPSTSRPRVVWAGLAKEHEPLVTPIAQKVIEALVGIGERDDRAFRPHITLARVRSGRNLRELEDLLRGNSERSFGAVRLSELKFKSSVLSPGGPVYKDLGVYPLE